MSRRHCERRPTEAAAISRATRPDPYRLPASDQQLRERLGRAVGRDDGHGIRTLIHLLNRRTP